MNRKYAVIFEQAETNWAAYVPDLPGCVSTGRTLEETELNVREAISGHLEALREFGEPVPEPTREYTRRSYRERSRGYRAVS
jgi:predicted RNase H-like HicB family nuclease